jgi:hypothetical protein
MSPLRRLLHEIHRRSLLGYLLACFTLGCTAAEVPKGFDLDAAHDLLTAYVTALASGDTALIRPFWSMESVAHEGFWHMHAWTGHMMPVSHWPGFLERFGFAIDGVISKTDHHVVEVEWVPKDTAASDAEAQVLRTRFYVVWEDDRWALIDPLEVLTRDWSIHESECFVFHYPADIRLEDHLDELSFMDAACGAVSQVFQIPLARKIDFFRARSPSEAGDLMLQRPSNGYASQARRLVVSVSFTNPHEFVHVLQAVAGLPDAHPALTEGLASAFGGNTMTTADFTLVEARNLLDEPHFIHLRDLLRLSDADFLRNNFVTYIEAGAFVRFLVARFGFPRLERLFVETGSPENLPSTIRDVYGQSVEELEPQWHAYLRAQDVPDPSPATPTNAELVFSMGDPSDDDLGDGDYVSPLHRTTPGVFDLRRFEVRKDDANAYFRLGFRELARPITVGGGERFLPGVVIAIDRASQRVGDLRIESHGVRLEEGSDYDLQLNVGVQVSITDGFGRVRFATRDIWDEMADLDANTLSFSLPLELVGDPASEWRFFVGVGLMTDRTMNFLFGGPAPVSPSHPVYINGGNYEQGNPAFVDILAAEAVDQLRVLGDYDGQAGRLAVVPMVGGRSMR